MAVHTRTCGMVDILQPFYIVKMQLKLVTIARHRNFYVYNDRCMRIGQDVLMCTVIEIIKKSWEMKKIKIDGLLYKESLSPIELPTET